MSLILDALNKADREHQSGVPDLNTRHRDVRPRHWRDLWLIALACCVVLLLAVIALLAFGRRDNENAVVADLAVKTAVQPGLVNESEPIAKRATVTVAELPVVQLQPADNPEVQELYRVQHGDIEVTEPTIDTEQPDEDAPLIGDDPEAAEDAEQLLTENSTAAADKELVEPADLDQDAQASIAADTGAEPRQTSINEDLVRKLWEDSRLQPLPPADPVAAPEPVGADVQPAEVDLTAGARFEDTLAALNEVPFLHELPVNKQNRIPTLMYAQHSFADQTVTLNKKSMTAGNTIAKGLVVERILADGVLLKFEDERFKLAALSSWVNY